MRRWGWTLLAVVLLATACGEPGGGSTAAPTTSPPSSSDPSPEGKSGWPKLGGAAIECVYDYPEDLVERPIAFDGTVETVLFGAEDEDAGARPARVEMRVNEVFRGDIDGFIVMNSWDFMVPGEEIVGTRVLAAAGHTLDLMACGFTRPYTTEDADMWRSTFAGAPPEDCGAEVLDCDLGDPTPVPASCDRP